MNDSNTIQEMKRKIPEFSKYLRNWGEADIFNLRNNFMTKIDNRGKFFKFMGYPESHAGDNYRIWDLQSK
jgi:hypothetical protein